MNSYADVTTFKSAEFANISANTEQVRFRRMLEAASRYLDIRCERFFYCLETTRYYDGKRILLDLDDLLSVTTFKLDEDGDATYEETLDTVDYILYPLNGYPKTWAEISSDSDYGAFASGTKKGVEIAGIFGYGDGWSATPYSDSEITVQDDPLTAAATTITLSAEDVISTGHTLRIEDEQIYVLTHTTDASKTCTVKRGVNGTTAASHVKTTAIYIYEYPQLIWQATLILAMRVWKRKDSAFMDAVGSPETGLIVMFKDEDPEVRKIIDRYRRRV